MLLLSRQISFAEEFVYKQRTILTGVDFKIINAAIPTIEEKIGSIEYYKIILIEKNDVYIVLALDKDTDLIKQKTNRLELSVHLDKKDLRILQYAFQK